MTRNGYQVTNAAGNLVDLNGNQINGAFLTNHPGFPGFGSINAAQTLAYVADMQESGVPVTYGVHLRHPRQRAHPRRHRVQRRSGRPRKRQSRATSPRPSTTTRPSRPSSSAWPPTASPRQHRVRLQRRRGRPRGRRQRRAGHPAHTRQLRRRDGDAARRSPRVACTYPAGSFGELDGNIHGLLATEKGNTTPFSLEADTAPEFYVTGNPVADAPHGPARSSATWPRSRPATHTPATLTSRSPTTSPTRPRRRSCTWSTPTRPERRPSPCSPNPTTYLYDWPGQLRRRPCVTPEHRLRLGPRGLRGRDQHQLGRAFVGPGVANMRPRRLRPRGRAQLGRRQQRPGDRPRAERDDRAPGWTKPTSARRSCT